MSRCATSLLFALILACIAATSLFATTHNGVNAQGTSIYGTMEAFSELRNSNNYLLVPNTPVPADCPVWAKEDSIMLRIMELGEGYTPAQVKALWNQYNLSPLISADFDINAFIDAISGVAPIADFEVNQSVQMEYSDMKDIVSCSTIWTQYGAGTNPQCVIRTNDVIPTVPPRPTDVTDEPSTTYFEGSTFPPFPTEPLFTGEPGDPSKPMYEQGSLVMMVDAAVFPKTTGGQYDFPAFLISLQAVVNFPTSTLQLNNDLWDSTQVVINNVTAAQSAILLALPTNVLATIGVVYIHATSNDFNSNDIILESDYNRLLNITATFERAKPLPSSCPLYLTNDTLLSQLASQKYPLQTAIPLFSDTYGKNFDGWNTSCLVQFWSLTQGQTPSCPADFGNVFPTLPAGSGSSGMPSDSSNIPSEGPSSPSSDVPSSPSSDLPSDLPSNESSNAPSESSGAPSPSGFFPTGTPNSDSGIPTTPSDVLACKVPFQDYAPCVLAQNTLGIILYLRDEKNAQPLCFCQGSECVTPPPSTLYPEVSANSNGSFDSGLPPIQTYPNETFPSMPDNMSMPSMNDNVSSNPFESIVESMQSEIMSMINHSSLPSEESTLPASGSGSHGHVTPSATPPGQTTIATTATPPGQTTVATTATPPGQTTTAAPPTTTTTTTTPAPPTTTSPKQLPNSVDFVKTSTFNATTFADKLSQTIGVPTSDFTVTQDPNNSSLIRVTFTTSDPTVNYQDTQKISNLTTSQLQSIGTSSSQTNSNSAATDTSTEAPAAKNNTPLIAGVVVAVVAVIAVVAFIVWNKSRNAARAGDKDGTVALDGYVNHQDFSDFNKGVSEKELSNLNSERGMHAV